MPPPLFRDADQFMKNLRMALVGELTAIDFYRRLLDMAPNDEHREQIELAYEDEKKHYRMFENLYIRLTGRRPDVKPMTVTFATYEEGLKKGVLRRVGGGGAVPRHATAHPKQSHPRHLL